jgi:hypothetical protein
MISEITSMLLVLLYWAVIYGLPCCLVVAALGALLIPRSFKAVFYKIFTWSITGTTIAVGGYSLFLLYIVFIVKDPAYRGQGLGIALAGPIIFAPLGAITGGFLKFILLNVYRRDKESK